MSDNLAFDVIAALHVRARHLSPFEARACERAAAKVQRLGLPDAVLAMDDDENRCFRDVVQRMMETEPERKRDHLSPGARKLIRTIILMMPSVKYAIAAERLTEDEAVDSVLTLIECGHLIIVHDPESKTWRLDLVCEG